MNNFRHFFTVTAIIYCQLDWSQSTVWPFLITIIAASPAPGSSYGVPEVGGNLDEKQICVDVSTFLPVEWTQAQGEQCITEFVQKCEERSENVCGEVTETLCEVSICQIATPDIQFLMDISFTFF